MEVIQVRCQRPTLSNYNFDKMLEAEAEIRSQGSLQKQEVSASRSLP